MSITVEGPDGAVIEFPDGTDEATMTRAMAAHYGGQPAPGSQPQPQPAPPKRKPSILGDINAGIEQAADWATLGGFSNYRAAADSALSNGKEGFLDAKARNASDVEDFNQRRPLAGVASKTIGGVAPALLTGGGSTVEQTLAKAPAGFWGRRAADAGKGALYGAVVGANQAVGKGDNPFQQLLDVGTNAGFGAVAGPVFGGSLEGAAKIGNSLARTAKAGARGNQTNMGLGVLDVGGEMPKGPALNKADAQMAARTGLTSDTLAGRVEPFNEAGIVPKRFQVFGEPGAQRMRTLANFPGKTGTEVARAIKQSRVDQPGDLTRSLNRSFGRMPDSVYETGLANRLKRVGQEYDPLFASSGTTLNPSAKPDVDAALALVPERIMTGANAQIKERATLRGQKIENISDARRAWYIYRHLNDEIGKAEINNPSMVPDMIPAKEALGAALEKGVPGFKAINQRYSAIKNEQDALAWGRGVLKTGRAADQPDQVAAEYARMSKQQKKAARIGLRGDVRRLLAEATGSVHAPKNATNAIKGEMYDKIRAILKNDAEPFINTLNVSGQTYQDMSFVAPRSGSNSIPMVADGMDMLANTPPTKSGITKIADEGLGWLWGKVTSPIMEGMRNTAGAKLIQDLPPNEQIKLYAALKQLEQERIAAVAASGSGGLFGAQFGQQAGQ